MEEDEGVSGGGEGRVRIFIVIMFVLIGRWYRRGAQDVLVFEELADA